MSVVKFAPGAIELALEVRRLVPDELRVRADHEVRQAVEVEVADALVVEVAGRPLVDDHVLERHLAPESFRQRWTCCGAS